MDNPALQILLLWPTAVIACALLSMAIWKTFSWSELIFDHITGIVIGAIAVAALAPGASPAVKFMLLPSHGLIGLLHLAGVKALADPVTFFWASSLCMLGATVLGAALDHAAVAIGPEPGAGSILLAVLMLPLKMCFAPLTTGVGLLFFLVGAVRALFPNGSVGFAAGVVYVQWDTSDKSYSAATTLGGTVQVWRGELKHLMDHELYHTRQYIYLHDWMIPMWLLGGIWGLISSAVADPEVKLKCFQAARKGQKGIGNPIEAAAYNISGGANC